MGDLQLAPPIITLLPNAGAQAVPGWARQNLLPGAAQQTNISVPGLRQLAGTRNGPGTKPNKAPLLTNEAVNTNVTASRWANNMDKRQKPGDLIFVGDPKERHRRTDMETMTLPQLNTTMRRLHSVAQAKAVDRYAGMVSEFTPEIAKADPEIKQVFANLAKWGEDWFNQKTVRETNYYTDKLSCVTGLSRRMLLERWVRLLGVYAADSGRGADFASRSHQTLSVQVGGPTRAQEVKNYWESVENGALLGLLLTREVDEKASTISKRVSGPFVLKPWTGYSSVPSFFERVYFDDAGLVQFAGFVPVGQVVQQPLDYNSSENCSAAAGLTADEAAVWNMHTETVMIDVGVRRRFRDTL